MKTDSIFNSTTFADTHVKNIFGRTSRKASNVWRNQHRAINAIPAGIDRHRRHRHKTHRSLYTRTCGSRTPPSGGTDTLHQSIFGSSCHQEHQSSRDK